MDLVMPYPDATQVDATPAMVAKVSKGSRYSIATKLEWIKHKVVHVFLHLCCNNHITSSVMHKCLF